MREDQSPTSTPSREIVIPGRTLTVKGRPAEEVAQRRTAGETFSPADFELMMKGVPATTKATAERAWKRVLEFTAAHGYCEVPMPVETCVKMIDAQWQRPGRYGRPTSPKTIRLMLWVVTKAHEVTRRPDGTRGYVSPVKSVEVRKAMAGYIEKWLEAGHRPDKATPIDPDELVAMVEACDPRSPVGLRDALALALGYDMGARARELCDERAVRYEDVEVHVAGLADLEIDPDRPQDIPVRGPVDDDEHAEVDFLVVHIPMSKTDREGDGDEVFIYAHPPRSASSCPVRLWLAWRERLTREGWDPAGPVLRHVIHAGPPPKDGRPRKGTITARPLPYDGFEQLFARAVRAAGLDNAEGRRRHFAIHGLRAGSAEAAAAAGADTPELNRHFRWSQKGTTAQQYAARGLKRRRNAARRVWTTRRSP